MVDISYRHHVDVEGCVHHGVAHAHHHAAGGGQRLGLDRLVAIHDGLAHVHGLLLKEMHCDVARRRRLDRPLWEDGQLGRVRGEERGRGVEV